MGFRSRFIAGLGWRAAALLGTISLFVAGLAGAGLGVARLLAGGLCLWATYELWRYIQRTNMELARFLEAVRLGDLSQSFAHRADGSGFTDIGRALDQGIRNLRDERLRLTESNRFCEAVLDDAPAPLLTVDSDGRVEDRKSVVEG